MKSLKKIAVATVICMSLAGVSVVVQAKSPTQNDAVAVGKVSVTLEQAVSAAQQVFPGLATKAELSTDSGSEVWEVEIVSADQQVADVEIDATTGKVLKQKVDKVDSEDDDHEDDGDSENSGNGDNDKEDRD